MNRVTVSDYNKFLLESLENCDTEKQLLLAKLGTLETAQRDLGDLRTELLERTSELQKTQQGLSEQRLLVAEEREKVARLMNENAVLQAQVQDDREKIASLLRLQQTKPPVPESVEYPVRVSVLRNQSAKAERKAAHANPNESMSLRSVVTSYAQPQHETHVEVIRNQGSDVLPSGSGLVGALSREVAALKEQLEEQRRVYEQERAVRVMEERSRSEQQENTLAKYNKTVEHMQNLLNNATRDHVTSEHKAQIQERELRGEIEALTAQLSESKRNLDVERGRKTADVQMAIESANNRSHDVISTLRSSLKTKEANFNTERDRLVATLEERDGQIDKLKTALSTEKKRSKRMSERQKLENEGMQTEINLMKQHLRSVEKKVYFHHKSLITAPPVAGEANY